MSTDVHAGGFGLQTADCPSRQESISHLRTRGRESGRRGRREGVVSEQTELLNCAAQMKAAGHCVCHSECSDLSSSFSSLHWWWGGGWLRTGSARVPAPCNRMHLVVEPFEEAVMKMLPVFMDKAGLTQREINHMWVQFIFWNPVGARPSWTNWRWRDSTLKPLCLGVSVICEWYF